MVALMAWFVNTQLQGDKLDCILLTGPPGMGKIPEKVLVESAYASVLSYTDNIMKM
jgi:Holliday junction resolvasome RuvABC ATP-dependent DNA helicase subunit